VGSGPIKPRWGKHWAGGRKVLYSGGERKKIGVTTLIQLKGPAQGKESSDGRDVFLRGIYSSFVKRHITERGSPPSQEVVLVNLTEGRSTNCRCCRCPREGGRPGAGAPGMFSLLTEELRKVYT